ncbi:hypothetical protein BOVATA_040570 [Babesia ovata]|uniref:Uncharacterized protein n=1 Tax=Babesia ovata TaxID=189622 RepID=A0A2H6KHU7_9APIC|nr:uncharacterized protein BOVATA_040570 [Babesia ovata]GBE62564.1 hypothetical protein BOVATA_040570 [Babesia ovata]
MVTWQLTLEVEGGGEHGLVAFRHILGVFRRNVLSNSLVNGICALADFLELQRRVHIFLRRAQCEHDLQVLCDLLLEVVGNGFARRQQPNNGRRLTQWCYELVELTYNHCQSGRLVILAILGILAQRLQHGGEHENAFEVCDGVAYVVFRVVKRANVRRQDFEGLLSSHGGYLYLRHLRNEVVGGALQFFEAFVRHLNADRLIVDDLHELAILLSHFAFDFSYECVDVGEVALVREVLVEKFDRVVDELRQIVAWRFFYSIHFAALFESW